MAHWDWEENDQAGLHPSKLTWGSHKSPTGSADAAPRASYTDGQLLL